MKKAAILTLNGYFNYGNRLQNYALQRQLEKMNLDVTTIWLDKNNNTFKIKVKTLIKNIIKSVSKNNSKYNRERKFIEFSKTYIHETDKQFNVNKNLSKLNEKYDYFIIGSDQVWNPSMNAANGAYFANFADSNKRIAYSASFGISILPESVRAKYKKWINELAAISVREKQGTQIIKELTGRDSEVLVDPTLLLDKIEWESISREAPKRADGKYLLTYFLGELPENVRKDVNTLSNRYGLKVINLGDPKDKIVFETGPAEFIDYIMHSEIFLTDSFHGAVFSIIFEKPFVVYERVGSENMFSRIATLLEKFNLERRFRKNIDFNSDILQMDYSQTKELLIKEKNKSIVYLTNSMNTNNHR